MTKKSKEIQQLQYEICKIISNIGGRIVWAKEYGLLARLNYLLSKKEPVINVEALFLGERFAVIINPLNKETRTYSDKYRIISTSGVEDFTRQFEAFKMEKLEKD